MIFLIRLGTSLAATFGAATLVTARPTPHAPIAGADLVFEEVDGLVAFEAEHFFKQELTDLRAWHIVHAGGIPDYPDDVDDSPHVLGTSGGAYLEILPDTRATHDHVLTSGVNFSNEPGKMAIISYKVHFDNPGRYHVWCRIFSTGGEDNGTHVGINGTWPESGQRWQTIKKRAWQWDSRQRTKEVHVGVPGQLFIDVPTAGEHVIQLSMREDGFELDKVVLTSDRDYEPEGLGPAPRVKAGELPEPFALPAGYPDRQSGAAEKASVSAWQDAPEYPAHWGEPPMIQTRDLVPLPGGYGRGSSTLAKWIQSNLETDAAAARGEENALVQPRQPHGDGSIEVSGELKQWHKITLDLAGPFAHEGDNLPNPFTDYRFHVVFTHEAGAPVYTVPGYFAADGNAAETSAVAGSVWRAHFAPDQTGTWTYRTVFVQGDWAAIDPTVGEPVTPYHGIVGTFDVGDSDKSGRDFRGKGRLQYVGGHYLQHAGSGEFFLKAGPDAPETLLAYADFDGTERGRKQPARPGEAEPSQTLKTWQPHVQDWNVSDPNWQGGKGKGLVGALNYLAEKGVNNVSFLPYNAGGDGDNVWPFVSRMDKFRYDCSKLDQWGIVFSHAQKLGLHLHFKLQENEIDDNRAGHAQTHKVIPEAMDGGLLGPERKLYLREIIARFGHNLALNWNLGEENTQSYEEQRDMAAYIKLVDPYDHHIVIHTFPNEQDLVYRPLLGAGSVVTGTSAQNHWSHVHRRTLQWIRESEHAGRPWVVANDEQNPASLGVPPDPGYDGFSGYTERTEKEASYSLHDIRKKTLWGNLMAGGAGVEYYFGYQLPQNDLVAEDFRSRDQSWDYCRIALEFFRDEEIPFWEMCNANALVGNTEDENSQYCFAKAGKLYLVYLTEGGTAQLDLSDADGSFNVSWFNPRTGGELESGSVKQVNGGGKANLGNPPTDPDEDWLAVLRK